MTNTLCRVCGEQPAFADTGVCRWESCEHAALREDAHDEVIDLDAGDGAGF
jgi:hypothetical protein